ncbi:MAG: deoxynucleoside kinase [Spirochaetales bacterium]|nr:deoxynucleoside kinase [Spirochaetales bacterium]
MAKKHLIIAGNIGAGKSTLVEILSTRLGFRPYYEPVAENPYLQDFYGDMERWALQSQIFFLSHRVKSHHLLKDDPHSVVQDRSLYEDAQIFAQNLFIQGSMSRRDWDTYQELYKTLVQLLPPPDGALYIRASVRTLQRRIALRGRNFEDSIPPAYLKGLNELYEQWISNFDLCPVITIPGDEIDFVSDPTTLGPILEDVKEMLKGGQAELFG